MTDTRLMLSSITVVRPKRLKGGRYVVRSARTIKCRVPLVPNDKGHFVLHIYNDAIRAKLEGTLVGDTIHMENDRTKIWELRASYLKKGFDRIVGYSLHGNVTNIQRRSD